MVGLVRQSERPGELNLMRALRLKSTSRLALVGAGGKTTALFAIARQMIEATSPGGSLPGIKSVLLTSTTHLALEQLSLADHHFALAKPADLLAIAAILPPGVILLTGERIEEGRISGLDAMFLDRILALADAQGLPLLIEADGSRRRPFKAPAPHEPVIPTFVDTVVVMAGLSALGKPLSAEWVHRPERFAEVSGLGIGEPLTSQALVRLLTSPQGGLQGIPPHARRVALLNQAELSERQAQAQSMVPTLLDAYHAVVVAALAPSADEAMADQLFDNRAGVYAVHEPVAGIVLAAGGSTRLGQVKQLLLWRGEAFVRHVVHAALSAGLSPVVVVTGCAATEVRASLQDLPAACVDNPDWQKGQSTSVIAGLNALPPETGAAVFLLADQPQVPARLLRSLIETHSLGLSPLVAPLVDGQRANPALFDRQTFASLASITGDIGGRALFARFPVTWLPWHDPQLLLDVDTPDDYRKLLEI